jgi:hypothetical protein
MIKARVSKNLKGTIMLPTISPVALYANKEVVFTEEQFSAADIQGALRKHLLIMLDGPSVKSIKMAKVTNLSFGSVTLPNVGVVRAGKSMEINADLLKTPVYIQMVDSGLIAVNLKFKTGTPMLEDIETANVKPKGKRKEAKADEVEPVIPPNMQKGRAITMDIEADAKGGVTATPKRAAVAQSKKAAAKKGTPDKKKHGIRKVEDSLLIDPNSDAEDEAEDFLLDPRTGKKVTGDDGIIFVDHEQAQQRMNPKLRKKG